jgi:MFS family permease
MIYYKNKWLLYIINFFQNLIPAYVIERLFYQERGMTVKLVVYCEIVYAIAILLFEIPSGVLADKIGRKKLVVISCILQCFEFFALVYANTFWHFAMITFSSGIGSALSSGAFNALLYDSLKCGNKEYEFERICGNMNAMDFAAALIAALCGGYLAFRFGFTFNYWLSTGSALLTVICSLLLYEPITQAAMERRITYRQIITTAFSFFRSYISAFKICMNSIVIAACVVYIDEFWQLYLEHLSFPIKYFGIVLSVICIGSIFGSMLSTKLLKYMKRTNILICTSFLCGVGIVIAAIVQSVVGILGLVLAISMAALINPLAMGYLHHHADNEARATIESISSLLERIFSIALGLFFGYVATKINIIAGFWVIGIFVIIIALVFTFVFHSKRYFD